jgi:hypothetical protein
MELMLTPLMLLVLLLLLMAAAVDVVDFCVARGLAEPVCE